MAFARSAASSRAMRRPINWPVVLATLFVVLLAGHLWNTQRIFRVMRADAERIAQIYNEVQGAISDTTGAVIDNALFRMQELVVESGIPLVVTGAADTVLYVQNLPMDVDIGTPEGQLRVRDYARRIDAGRQPLDYQLSQRIHVGDSAEVRQLRWMPWIQALGLLLTVLVGFSIVTAQRRAEAEKAWTAMARELAHQLGTPISSLQGWLEVLRLPRDDRPGDVSDGEIAEALAEDLVRLERISHRFELIGREPVLEDVSLAKVVRDLESYLQARLPRLGRGVQLAVDVPGDLPRVQGNEVLLAWALENVVKNALDALAGRGGQIRIEARAGEPGWVTLRIRDSGPGVEPEIRDRIFDAGVTTKSGGWGVGLALSRRIVEGVHGGRIVLLDGRGSGATFQIRLPAGRVLGS
jgi:signal transduction histidine kinase